MIDTDLGIYYSTVTKYVLSDENGILDDLRKFDDHGRSCQLFESEKKNNLRLGQKWENPGHEDSGAMAV